MLKLLLLVICESKNDEDATVFENVNVGSEI